MTDDGKADLERLGPVARWRWYLPMDCPVCGRRRLEYRTNDNGNVVEIKCEKCGASSDD